MSRVHERLAAGEADLARGSARAAISSRKAAASARRDVDEPVVLRARFDVAVAAGDVAEGAGVDPQRRKRFQRARGARLAVRGPVRIAEFAGVCLNAASVHDAQQSDYRPLGLTICCPPQGTLLHPVGRAPFLPLRPSRAMQNPWRGCSSVVEQ